MKTAIKIFLVVILLTFTLAGASQGQGQGQPPGPAGGGNAAQLVITGAQVDLNTGTVLISGENFGTSEPFSGTIDLFTPGQGVTGLVVLTFDPAAQEVLALLPSGIDTTPGNFLLTISTGAGTANFDTFHLTIGAVGLEGPPGEPGPSGPVGPVGPAGLHCWDTTGNGICDLASEDTNGDGVCDAQDCQGTSGLAGMTCPPATVLTGFGPAGELLCETLSQLLCGNGVLDPGEACDDGNREAGDGCSEVCQVEPLTPLPAAGMPLVYPPEGFVRSVSGYSDFVYAIAYPLNPYSSFPITLVADLFSADNTPLQVGLVLNQDSFLVNGELFDLDVSEDGIVGAAWPGFQYSEQGVGARILHSDGSSVGELFLPAPSNLLSTGIAIDGNDVAICWTELSGKITIARYQIDATSNTLTSVGGNLEIVAGSSFSQEVTDIDLRDGVIVVAFKPVSESLFLRRLDFATGQPLEADVVVRAVSGQFFGVHVTTAASGELAVAWTESGLRPDGFLMGDLFVRRYDANLAPMGAEIPVSHTSGDFHDQGHPVLGPGGVLSVFWWNHPQNGTYSEMFCREVQGQSPGPVISLDFGEYSRPRYTQYITATGNASGLLATWSSWDSGAGQPAEIRGVFACEPWQ